MDTTFKFKETHTLENRKNESDRIVKKYEGRIPCVIEACVNKNSKDLVLDKNKYLVPCDLTMSQLMHVIRKRIEFDSEEALFIFVIKDDQNHIVSPNQTLDIIQTEYVDEDGFLYFKVSKESTFG